MRDLPVPAPEAVPVPSPPPAAVALRGAALTSLPLIAVAATLVHFESSFRAVVLSVLRSLLAPALALELTRTSVLLMPLVLALPLAWLVRSLIQRFTPEHSPARRAAAAGVGIGSLVVTVGFLTASMGPLGLIQPMLIPASLGIVGILGTAAFRGERRVPGLYQACLASGLVAPVIQFGGGGLIRLLSLHPWLHQVLLGAGPRTTAPVLAAYLLGHTLVHALLAPVLYGIARLLGGNLPSAARRPLLVGMLLPAILAAAYFLLRESYIAAAYGVFPGASELVMLTSVLIGGGIHFLAVRAGLGAGETPEALPPGSAAEGTGNAPGEIPPDAALPGDGDREA